MSLERPNDLVLRVAVALDESMARRVIDLLTKAQARWELELIEAGQVPDLVRDGAYELFLVDPVSAPPRGVRAPRHHECVIIGVVESAEERVEGMDETVVLEAEALCRPFHTALMRARELVRLRRELREAEARRALIFAGAQDLLWEWELHSDRFAASPRWLAVLQLGEAESIGEPEAWFDRVHPDDLEPLQANLQAHLDGLTPRHEYEHRVRDGRGKFRWFLSRGVARRDTHGRALAIAGSLSDIDGSKSMEARLRAHADHDVLTGLASRSLLMARIDQVLGGTGAGEHALLFLNVDRFKVVNDSIGLESGDQILSELGERLLACCSSQDLACRYGGDEFVILVREIGAKNAAKRARSLAQRVHEALLTPFRLSSQEVFATVSIGIIGTCQEYARGSEVLRDASLATNHAKRQGKSGTAEFEPGMRRAALEVMRLHNALRQAVEREEFRVWYQPIVKVDDGSVSGFEALLRWQHPRRGIVGPIEFVGPAEETGLIVPIGAFVLQEACRQMAKWREEYGARAQGLTIAINISARQLAAPGIVEQIEEALEQSGLPGEALKLELTESVLIRDPDRAIPLLERLRARGVRVYIDDFGTGYSSLSYLHRFAVDGLKIDKSFVEVLGPGQPSSPILPTIIKLANALEIGVIAEGVEKDEQAQLLRGLQCREAQGYLYSPPVPAEDAAALLALGQLGQPRAQA